MIIPALVTVPLVIHDHLKSVITGYAYILPSLHLAFYGKHAFREVGCSSCMTYLLQKYDLRAPFCRCQGRCHSGRPRADYDNIGFHNLAVESIHLVLLITLKMPFSLYLRSFIS
jgi:hypothetical protein